MTPKSASNRFAIHQVSERLQDDGCFLVSLTLEQLLQDLVFSILECLQYLLCRVPQLGSRRNLGFLIWPTLLLLFKLFFFFSLLLLLLSLLFLFRLLACLLLNFALPTLLNHLLSLRFQESLPLLWSHIGHWIHLLLLSWLRLLISGLSAL